MRVQAPTFFCAIVCNASIFPCRSSFSGVKYLIPPTYVILTLTWQPCAMPLQIILNLRKVPVCYPLSPDCVYSFYCCWIRTSLRQSDSNIFQLGNKSSKYPATCHMAEFMSLPGQLISNLPPHLIPTPRSPLWLTFSAPWHAKELSYRCFVFEGWIGSRLSPYMCMSNRLVNFKFRVSDCGRPNVHSYIHRVPQPASARINTEGIKAWLNLKLNPFHLLTNLLTKKLKSALIGPHGYAKQQSDYFYICRMNTRKFFSLNSQVFPNLSQSEDNTTQTHPHYWRAARNAGQLVGEPFSSGFSQSSSGMYCANCASETSMGPGGLNIYWHWEFRCHAAILSHTTETWLRRAAVILFWSGG